MVDITARKIIFTLDSAGSKGFSFYRAAYGG
jgi:hypothetical protein